VAANPLLEATGQLERTASTFDASVTDAINGSGQLRTRTIVTFDNAA
jgi:hypothetical protein